MDSLINIFSDKKILITGHTGFKGSWLSLWLSQLGANIYGISLNIPTSPSNYQSSEIGDLVNDIRIDVRDFEKLKNYVCEIQPDFIFHLAAQPLVNLSFANPIETWETNTLGTLNLLESIRLNLKKCVAVFITSDKVYDNKEWSWGYREIDKLGGSDPYSASKASAELSISSYNRSFFNNSDDIRICSVRAGNVIGGGDWALNRIIPDCLRSWMKSEPVLLRNPYSTRPWQHVLEPLSGYLNVAAKLYCDSSLSGESYNFGPPSEQNKSVKELVESLSKFFPDSRYEIESVDKNAQKESKLLKLNCDKVQSDLGWFPTLNFTQTLNLTASWYKDYCDNPGNTRNISLEQIKFFSEMHKTIAFN